jgi:hypothetical protein
MSARSGRSMKGRTASPGLLRKESKKKANQVQRPETESKS